MAALLVGAGIPLGAFLISRFYKQRSHARGADTQLIPITKYGVTGVVNQVELFGDYVARQLGLPRGLPVAVLLAQIAEDYLRGDNEVNRRLMELFMSDDVPETTAAEIAVDFIHELDCCILSYFSFHWHHSGFILDQIKAGVQGKKTSLKKVVSEITRTKCIQKVVRLLCPAEKIMTLCEQLHAISFRSRADSPSPGQVMVPADPSQRSPVLLMVGGGMGAGKSTVVKEILTRGFWAKEAHNAVVVEADAFKEKSLIFQTLKSVEGVDLAHVSQMVHESSTTAASSTLVAALNEGRDIIFDGTMSWEPFVVQTVEMVRNCHKQQYKLGPGYKRYPDGSVVEKYWEYRDDDADDGEYDEEDEESEESGGAGNGEADMGATVGRGENQPQNGDGAASRNVQPRENGSLFQRGNTKQRTELANRKPYRIEFVGVTCDAALAVARGMRRAILTGRGVPVESQLRSHKMFAMAFEKYCSVVDQAALYCTNDPRGCPQLIAWKDYNSKVLTDAELYEDFLRLRTLNEKAGSISDLYPERRSERATASKLPLLEMLHNPARGDRQKRVAAVLKVAPVRSLSQSQTSPQAVSSKPSIAALFQLQAKPDHVMNAGSKRIVTASEKDYSSNGSSP